MSKQQLEMMVQGYRDALENQGILTSVIVPSHLEGPFTRAKQCLRRIEEIQIYLNEDKVDDAMYAFEELRSEFSRLGPHFMNDRSYEFVD